MKSINVPNESFESRNEVDTIHKLLTKNIDTLQDCIDDSVEIWIVGNKFPEFLKELSGAALSENRIYDPFDELPIGKHKKLLHLAVINYNKTGLDRVTREILYGNADYNIYDFIRSLIFRLASKFPKTGDIDFPVGINRHRNKNELHA